MKEFDKDYKTILVFIAVSLGSCVFLLNTISKGNTKIQTQVESTKYVQSNDSIKTIQINQKSVNQR